VVIYFMQKFLLIVAIVFTKTGIAQVPMAMPPDANAFYNKAMPLIKPHLKKIVIHTAFLLKNRRANADSLSNALHTNPGLKGMSDENIEGMTTLIMVHASKDADEDLKKMVLSMRNNEAEPVANKNVNANANKTNVSSEEINDKKLLMLQMIMNRKSKIAEEISLVLKKIPENKENIINNLK
ncbi:MAG: hypothetical protein ABJA71_16810, partial [Ginsengibacter sp.]